MRLQSSNALGHRPGLDMTVKLYQETAKLFYPLFTKSRSTNNSFDRISTAGTFQALSVVGEGTSFPDMDYRNPFVMDVTPLKYGGIFSVSSEAMETDKTGEIGRKTMKLLRAADKAIETLCADIHNLATSTSMTTPDGLALASASHLIDGAVASNIVTSSPALSATALATAVQELMTQPDDSGDPMYFTGPYKLLVHPSNADLAHRLVEAQKYPTTNNNDPNWAGQMIDGVVVNPYFTNANKWSLLSSGSDNPFVLLKRRGVRVSTDEDFRKDGMDTRVDVIFTRYPEDWRGFIFSDV